MRAATRTSLHKAVVALAVATLAMCAGFFWAACGSCTPADGDLIELRAEIVIARNLVFATTDVGAFSEVELELENFGRAPARVTLALAGASVSFPGTSAANLIAAGG